MERLIATHAEQHVKTYQWNIQVNAKDHVYVHSYLVLYVDQMEKPIIMNALQDVIMCKFKVKENALNFVHVLEY